MDRYTAPGYIAAMEERIAAMEFELARRYARIAELEAALRKADTEAVSMMNKLRANDEHFAIKDARIAELEATTKKVFDDMWILLDAVAMEADDTLWYDGGTTAHERLCDIAARYSVELSAELAQRLEESC